MVSACGDTDRSPTDARVPIDAAPIDAPPPVSALQIKTLSNRADMISGGDVLVEIVLPANAPSGLHVVAGTTEVSTAFARRGDGRTIGLITGLKQGETVITADAGGRGTASLTVTNHPVGGPVFSGPQIQPWVCATPVPTAGDDVSIPATSGSGLSTEAIDAQCNIVTERKLYYRTTVETGCSLAVPDPSPPATPPANGCFKPYDPASPPTDIKTITTDTGVTVPYIVRVERGTLNRGIYDIAVLIDPTQVSDTGWDPAAPPPTWNRKVVYQFGQSTGQPRRQQRSSQPWPTQDEALRRGFLVAVNSMTDSALNSNRTSMTETLMMMKEHIVDTYGEVRYTIGAGCSGGSINQLTASSIYPGLLDGVQPTCTYPDSETTGIEVADCELLVRFYASDVWKELMTRQGQTTEQNNAKQAAINGHLDQNGCRSWFNLFIGVGRPGRYHRETVGADGTITAAAAEINNCALPNPMVYSPDKPELPRCTGQDHAVSVWGKVPGASYAPTTRDNVGVVYGLKAYIADAIKAEELVVLNENVGGANFDIEHTATRSVADQAALEIAYKAGIVLDGRQLAKTAIIDVRGFDESVIHHTWRSFSLRARLDAANGNHANHVLWRFSTGLTAPPASRLSVESLQTMDRWLSALRADTSGATLEQRILATKPADGFDFCYLTLDTGFLVKVKDQALCDADPRLKAHASPRQVAGGPVAENIFKCQLKPFARTDYPGLSPTQLDRLQAVFHEGVCDWSKPGVGQVPAESPRDFTAGPGGVAFPAAPTSRAL